MVALVIMALMPINFCLALEPNDAYYVWQKPVWDAVRAPVAWNISTGSKKVIVAVIDSGVDILNKDLKDNIWTNSREIADNGQDDDNNGFIDDIHGWNFIDNNNNPRNLEVGGVATKGAVEHGTVLAGLIGAVGNNGQYGTGVNWQVQIMPLRAIESTGSGFVDTVIESVNYAVNNGAQVISLSFVGTSNDENLRAALYRAYQKGVVVVAAAGNAREQGEGDLDAHPVYPVCYDNQAARPWIFGVSSVNLNNTLSNFANFGSCVDIVAPGESIFSTEVFAPDQGFDSTFGGEWAGTSFSAPLVAGTAALMKSIYPALTPDEILSILKSTAVNIEGVNPVFAHQLGAGTLDIGRAAEQTLALKNLSVKGKVVLFLRANSVFELDTQSSAVTELYRGDRNKARIIWADMGSGLEGGMLAVLLQRDSFFYLRLMSKAGVLQKEIFLPVSALGNNFKKIMVVDRQKIVLEEFDPRRQQSIFSSISFSGEKAPDKLRVDQVKNWAINGNNNLVIAKLQAKGLQLEAWDWRGAVQHTFFWPGVTNVYDLKIGDLWQENGRDQVVLLVQKNKEQKQIVVDFITGSYREDVLNLPVGINPHILLFDPADNRSGENILVFSATGGRFVEKTARGKFVKERIFPEVGGQIF